MSEIDFYTFGIVSNDALLERINRALDGIYAFGDFELRSAWLYHGTKREAAQALGIPIPLYREALTRPKYTKGKGVAFDSMPDKPRRLLLDGANMILEMADNERKALFPENRQPRMVKQAFVKKVESWKAARLASDKRMWQYRHRPRIVFESSVSDPLKAILRSPSSIENKAGESEVCSAALEIIREYETYRWHREQINKHKKTQRKILDGKRSFFLEALILRDGKRCAYCKSTRQLRIDHIHPLSLGGFTEMSNLQLLCFPCNSKKSNKPGHSFSAPR